MTGNATSVGVSSREPRIAQAGPTIGASAKLECIEPGTFRNFRRTELIHGASKPECLRALTYPLIFDRRFDSETIG